MKKIFSLVVLVMTIAGCGNKIPACGDPEVIKKVSQLIAEKVNETEDADLKKFIKDRLIIDIANPIVVSENEKLGKRECKSEGKYTAQEDHLKHMLSVDGNAEAQEDVGFRWRLMTGALSHMEYMLLEEIKVKIEKAGDKKLADLIDGRWNNFKEAIGVKDNPVALFATLMDSKVQSDVNKSAKEQQSAFLKYLEQLDKIKDQ